MDQTAWLHIPGDYKHRFRLFENRMLRRIFGFRREEVIGEWRKEELCK
jgi:hypothetical protein